MIYKTVTLGQAPSLRVGMFSRYRHIQSAAHTPQPMISICWQEWLISVRGIGAANEVLAQLRSPARVFFRVDPAGNGSYFNYSSAILKKVFSQPHEDMIMADNQQLENEAFERLSGYVRKLKSIPINAIKFYLENEHQLRTVPITAENLTEEDKPFSFAPKLIDRGSYQDILYEFPKYYGHNKGKVEFFTDLRKKYAWSDEQILTKDHLDDVFLELKKQELIRPVFSFEKDLTDSEEYKEKIYEFPKWWLSYNKKGIPKFLTKDSDKPKNFDSEQLTKLQLDKFFDELKAQGLIRELK